MPDGMVSFNVSLVSKKGEGLKIEMVKDLGTPQIVICGGTVLLIAIILP